jgi:hypothetical protein
MNNTVREMTLTAASGAFRGIENTGAATAAINIDDNKLGDTTGGFVSYGQATSSVLTGILTTGGAAAGPALSIQRNDVRGISYAAASTGANDYINVSGGTSVSQTIKDNTFTNLSTNTTGITTLIRVGANLTSTPTAGTQTITNNSIVGSYTRLGASGSMFGLAVTATNTPGTQNDSNNNFSNVSLAGTTSGTCVSNIDFVTKTIQNNTCSNWGGSPAPSGNLTGIVVNSAPATITSNTITSWTGGGVVTGIQVNGNTNPATVTSNTVSGLTSTNPGTQGVRGIAVATPAAFGVSNTASVTSNNVNNLSAASATAAANVVGVDIGSANTQTATTVSVSMNVVKTLSADFAGSTVTGVNFQGSVNSGSVFRNTVYDLQLSAASGTVTGISSGGLSSNIYNNLVGDLRAPAATSGTTPTVRGLAAPDGAAASFSHNSVYITGTSSGSPFSTTAMFQSSQTPRRP